MNWSSKLWKPPEAVELAINKCIADGILTDILRVHRKEVSAMYLEEYDEERHPPSGFDALEDEEVLGGDGEDLPDYLK